MANVMKRNKWQRERERERERNGEKLKKGKKIATSCNNTFAYSG
jgi:hypothetical protein